MAIVLTSMTAITPFAIDMFLPSMPAMAVEFSAAPTHVQLAVTLFLASYAVSQLVFGPLSDRFGRRSVALAGLSLFTLAGLACTLAPSVEALIAARIFQGLAAGSGPVLARAVVRDIYGPGRAAKVLAYMATAMALAPVFAPIIGGYIQVWSGWRAVFVALTALGASVLGATWLGLPETNSYPDSGALQPRRMLANYRRLLSHRAFVGYSLVLTLIFGGLFTFISSSAFVLIGVLGVTPTVYGFCFAMVAFGIMTGAFLAGRLTGRWGIDRLILTGGALSVASSLLLAGVTWLGWLSVAGLVAPMYVFAVGGGMVMPSAMAGGITPFPRMAGLASALLGFLQMAGAATYSIGVGALYDGTAMPMTAGIACAAVCALAAFLIAAPYSHPTLLDDDTAPAPQPAAADAAGSNPGSSAATIPFPALQDAVLAAARVAVADAELPLGRLDALWARRIGGDTRVLQRLLEELQRRLPLRIPPGDTVNFGTLDDALAYLDLRLNGIAQ